MPIMGLDVVACVLLQHVHGGPVPLRLLTRILLATGYWLDATQRLHGALPWQRAALVGLIAVTLVGFTYRTVLVAEMQLNRGILFWNQGEVEKAMTVWQATLAADPEHTEARSMLERAKRRQEYKQ